MAAYLIVDSEITNQDMFAEYAREIVRIVERHGGRYLARGGATQVLEGNRTPHRVVVIEFESMERAQAYANDPEYAQLNDLRARSSTTTTFIVEGV